MINITNAPAFFAGVKAVTGPLNQTKLDVINDLVKRASEANWSIGWLAYGMATAWHEAHFTPQDEIGRGRGKKYGVPGKYGQIPFGRGLVQQTWDTNYEWADKVCHLNGAMLKNFDLANDPDIAAEVLILGMQSGHFTGVGLGHYINQIGTHACFVQARRIINSLDCADKIADYAIAFQNALLAGTGGVAAPTGAATINPASGVNMRVRADVTAPVVAVLACGAQVTPLSTSGDWSQVKVNATGASGWVKSQYLTAN